MVVTILQNCRVLWQSSECDEVCVGARGFTRGVYHSPGLCTEVCPVQAGALQSGQRAVGPHRAEVEALWLEVILCDCCIIINDIMKSSKKKNELQTTGKVFIYAWGQFYTGYGVGLIKTVYITPECIFTKY